MLRGKSLCVLAAFLMAPTGLLWLALCQTSYTLTSVRNQPNPRGITLQGKPGAVDLLLRDQSLPGDVWDLRIPENVQDDAGYIALSAPAKGVHWTASATVASYHLMVPTSVPDLSYFKILKFCPLPGSFDLTVQCKVLDDSVHYDVRVSNTSDRKWTHALAHLCLLHRAAQGFGKPRYIYVVTASGLSKGKTWKRSSGVYKRYALLLYRGSQTRNPFYTRYLNATGDPRVFGRFIFICSPIQNYCVGIAAERQLLFMNNAGNPCTDLALDLGDVNVYDMVEGSGRVYFIAGGPQQFLARVEEDFPLKGERSHEFNKELESQVIPTGCVMRNGRRCRERNCRQKHANSVPAKVEGSDRARE